jgi:hypothetical protein
MKRHLAAILLSTAIYGQELTCEQLKVQQTFEGTLMDGCREKMQVEGGCGAYILGQGYQKIDLEDGRFSFKDIRKLHQKQVTVTGTYYPNYPQYLTQCNHTTPFRGAPERLLEIAVITEIKKK